MSDAITKRQIQMLRFSFKHEDLLDNRPNDFSIVGDRVYLTTDLIGTYSLVIMANGCEIASCPIDDEAIRRLNKEMGFFKRLQRQGTPLKKGMMRRLIQAAKDPDQLVRRLTGG